MLFPILISSIIIFIAFFVRSLAGFGSALIAVPLLSLLFPVKFVIPLEMIFEIVVGLVLLPGVYKHINLKQIKNLIIGLFIGTSIAVYLLVNVNDEILKIILASIVFLTGISILLTVNKTFQIKLNKKWDLLFGALAGTIGGTSNMSGTILVSYISHLIRDKTKFRATLIGLFLVVGSYKVSLFAFSGLFTLEMFKVFLYLSPSFLLGIYLGNKTHLNISDKTFRYIISILLLVFSVILMIK